MALKKKVTAKTMKEFGFFMVMIIIPIIHFCIFWIGVNINSFALAFKGKGGPTFDYFKLFFQELSGGGKNAGFSSSGGDLYLTVNGDYLNVNVAEQEARENSLYNAVKKMTEIKRTCACLSSDASFELVSEDYPLVFRRRSGGKILTAVINPSAKEFTLDMQVIKNAEVLYSHNAVIENGKISVKGVSAIWLLNK